jgi:hypothetical protein
VTIDRLRPLAARGVASWNRDDRRLRGKGDSTASYTQRSCSGWCTDPARENFRKKVLSQRCCANPASCPLRAMLKVSGIRFPLES